MWLVKVALSRPYTFVILSLLILILGIAAIVTMPIQRRVIRKELQKQRDG